MPTLTAITTQDARFPMSDGAGADAIHGDPEYSYAVTRLHTDTRLSGTGGAFTLGAGKIHNDLSQSRRVAAPSA